MEEVITDQDTQIKNMREKLQSQIKEIKTNEIIGKQMNMINSRLNPAYDEVESELNKSANISRQINLENFKDGKIGNRVLKSANKKVDIKALRNALDLSYTIVHPDEDKREQSMIEDKIAARKRGISPFMGSRNLTPLIPRTKEGKNSDSTTAEGESNIKSRRLARLNSTGI
jgi:hypothetical protein